MAGTYNISLEQGADFFLQLTWTLNGTPVDLTGYQVLFVVRAKPDTPVLFEATQLDYVTPGSDGSLEVHVPGSITAGFGWKTPVPYQLWLTAPTGEITRLLRGQITVELSLR